MSFFNRINNPNAKLYVQNTINGHDVYNFDANASSTRLISSTDLMVKWSLCTNIHNKLNMPSVVYHETLNGFERKFDELLAIQNTNDRKYIYTSGASESNIAGIQACVNHIMDTNDEITLDKITIISSPLEHTSMINTLKRSGCTVKLINPSVNGQVSVENLTKVMDSVPDQNKMIVTIMGANNATGIINDILALAVETKNRGGLFHSDITQLIGKREVNTYFSQNYIDSFSLSFHKLGGFPGSGLLYLNERINFGSEFLSIPGKQQYGLRGGTVNPGLVLSGLNSLIQSHVDIHQKNNFMYQIKNYLSKEIKKISPIVSVLNYESPNYNNNIILINTGGLCSKVIAQQMGLNLTNRAYIIVGIGSACNNEDESIYQKIPIYDDIRNIIRVSFDESVTQKQCKVFLSSLKCSIITSTRNLR